MKTKKKCAKKRIKKPETFVMHKGNAYAVMNITTHTTCDENFDPMMETVYITAVRKVYPKIEDVS